MRESSMYARWTCALLLLVCLAFLVPGAGFAGVAPEAPVTQQFSVALDTGTTAVHWAGMKIAIDPTTGELRRPSEAQRQALRASFERVFGRLQEIEATREAAMPRHANGMRAKSFVTRQFNFSVYHLGDDHANCVSDLADVDALFSDSEQASGSER